MPGHLRQLHVRVSLREHAFLEQLAKQTEEPVAIVVRRLLRHAMRNQAATNVGGTAEVPDQLRRGPVIP